MKANWIKFVMGLIFSVCVVEAGLVRPVLAQDISEIESVKATNDAFYKALSTRNMRVLVGLWSYRTEIRHIGPRNKEVNVGLDAAIENWQSLFASLPEFKITCKDGYVRINGSTAWITGIETAQWKNESGETVTKTQFGTNIFEKQDGRWLMVFHHGSFIPQ